MRINDSFSSAPTLQTASQKRQEAEFHKLEGLAKAQYDTSAMSEHEKAQLKETCREIEQIFVKMMLSEMRKSINRPKLDSNAQNQGRDIFEEMLYDKYAASMTQQNGFGIADTIYNQLTMPVISPAVAAKRYNEG